MSEAASSIALARRFPLALLSPPAQTVLSEKPLTSTGEEGKALVEIADSMIRRARARRRLTQSGQAAWFGAFTDGRLLAQLGVCDTGGALARYQDVETDPGARRRGLAGTLVWRAGVYAAEAFGVGTLVIVADPAEEAIRVYRACGFADAQGQFSFERGPTG